MEPADYWDKMPLTRPSTFRHLPLEHVGAANCINENTVTRAHNRASALQIRMFTKGNQTKKGFAIASDSGKEAAESWEQPQ